MPQMVMFGYMDYAGGKLGRYRPGDGSVEEWASGSRPYGMAVNREDHVWLVETGVQPNRFVGFDTATTQFISAVPLKSGGGTVRHMVHDASRNVIWFGTDTNTLGRARLP